MSDREWFPRWFWWPFYLIGAPLLVLRWAWEQIRRFS